MSILRLYPGLNMSFEHNTARKNLFLSACFWWDSRLSLREMEHKFKFGGIIGYDDSYLEFLFLHSEEFRLYAIVHDAAGVVRTHSDKSPGYCYMIGRATLLSLRKTFSTCHFPLCRLSMSCIVIDIELADVNV